MFMVLSSCDSSLGVYGELSALPSLDQANQFEPHSYIGTLEIFLLTYLRGSQ